MVPALTEDDVLSGLQKHTAKTLNESNVAIYRPPESVERLSSIYEKEIMYLAVMSLTL